MANDFSSSLVVDTATSKVITILQNRLAPFRAFSTDFSDELIDPLKTVQVGLATDAGSVTTNPTNFETGDTTLTNAPISMVHYSKPFGLTSKELNQGFRLEKLININLHKLADALIDVALTPVTTTNFGNAVVTTDASFTTTGMQTLFGALKNGTSRALVLDGALYAKLLPSTKENWMLGEKGAYGWDGGIFMNNRWSGAVANCKGMAVSPEAIGLAACLPIVDAAVARQMLVHSTIQIPDLNIFVQFNVWGSLASRSLRASFDLCFGAAKADGSAAKLVIY
jgi:hypothetical protein